MQPTNLPRLLRALRRAVAIVLFIVVPGSLILAPLIWWIGHRNRGPARTA